MKKISNYDIEELKIVKEEYTTACEEIINSIGIEDFEFFASRRNGIYMPEERLKFEHIMNKLKNMNFFDLERDLLKIERILLHKEIEELNEKLDKLLNSEDYKWYKENKAKEEYFKENIKFNLGNAFKLKKIDDNINSIQDEIESTTNECRRKYIIK